MGCVENCDRRSIDRSRSRPLKICSGSRNLGEHEMNLMMAQGLINGYTLEKLEHKKNWLKTPLHTVQRPISSAVDGERRLGRGRT